MGTYKHKKTGVGVMACKGENMKDLEVIYKKIDELIPYENNPRNNDGAVEAVAKSIKEFGFKVPIVIDKEGVIAAGHTRLKAAKELGLKEVPCVIADDLTPEKIKAFRLADNKVSELAEWDLFSLENELQDIPNIDMKEFGFIDEAARELQEVDIQEKELVPFIKVHYLISADINLNDEIMKTLDKLKGLGGIEIESSLN